MFKFCEGARVKNIEGLENAYEIIDKKNYKIFEITLSSEITEKIITDFIPLIEHSGFLVVEIPTNQNIEKEIRKNENDPFHMDVYYLDGLNNSEFKSIFNQYRELLLNDGFVRFGFGAHKGTDEFFVSDYKILHIYTNEEKKYETILEKYNVKKMTKIRTVWDNFSYDSPGERISVHKNGINVYDMIDELKEKGLYFAERREE